MKRKSLLLVHILVCSLAFVSCNKQVTTGRDIYSDLDDNEDIDLTNAVTITGYLSEIVNPPFLKKVDMYNAGCINPVDYYERDMEYSKDLNFNSLRIDLSAGKANGNGGKFLVTDEFETVKESDTTYSIVEDSLHYDFSDFDNLMTYFKEMNALPYMSWCYIPYPLQQNENWKKFDDNVTNWQEIWEEVYYQYAKHCLDNNIRIGYHELYNEPDLEMIRWWNEEERDTFAGFLDYRDFAPEGDPSKGKYFDMYKYGLEGILRADEDATVGGPAYAIGETAVWSGLIDKIAAEELQMDFFSFHSYMDGETWYIPDETRIRDNKKNELEDIVQRLAMHEHYLKTQLHISEFSPLNDDNGAKEGLNSLFNTYRGASRTFDGLDEIINRTSVQLISWAQLMSVNSNKNDAYGIIDKNGNIKSSYNALRIYQDMPVWRYAVSSNNTDGIKAYLAANDDKISILLWNTNSSFDEEGVQTTAGDRLVRFNLEDCWLDNATRRVYRIDEDHATSYDYADSPELVAQNVRTYNHTDNKVWGGVIPAEGTVYITINRGANEDFIMDYYDHEFAHDIKTEYWYEDRYRQIKGNDEHYDDYANNIHGSFANFNRKNWTAYLGLGDCEGKRDGTAKGEGVALTAVTCDNLPTNFYIKKALEGTLDTSNNYANLGVRIDFYNDSTSTYDKSVFLHDGVFTNADYRLQDSLLSSLDKYPFGTKREADANKQYDPNNKSWNVRLNELAPTSWLNSSRRAIISFYMRNTGENTRCMFQLWEGNR